MAICDACNLEMTDPATTTCVVEPITLLGGESLPQVPFTHTGGHPEMIRKPSPFGGTVWSMTDHLTPLVELPDGTRCHDCNILKGGVHHPGCDAERCPRCAGQIISCGCLPGDEGDE